MSEEPGARGWDCNFSLKCADSAVIEVGRAWSPRVGLQLIGGQALTGRGQRNSTRRPHPAQPFPRPSFKTLLANARNTGKGTNPGRFCRFLRLIPDGFLAQTVAIPLIVSFANKVF